MADKKKKGVQITTQRKSDCSERSDSTAYSKYYLLLILTIDSSLNSRQIFLCVFYGFFIVSGATVTAEVARWNKGSNLDVKKAIMILK